MPLPMHDVGRLRSALREELDEPRTRRIWDGVQQQRAQSRPRSAKWVLSPLLGALATALVIGLSWPGAPGPLTLSETGPVPTSIRTQGDSHTLALSDQSSVHMDPDTHLDLLVNTGDTLSLALRAGRARFNVHPGGPRQWNIECGLLKVQVVGTAFTLERDERHVWVSVHRGAVLVRGDLVPDKVQRLNAGDTLLTEKPEAGEDATASSKCPEPEPAKQAADPRRGSVLK